MRQEDDFDSRPKTSNWYQNGCDKQGGIDMLYSNSDIKTRTKGVLMWVDSHYWRALECMDSRQAKYARLVLSSGLWRYKGFQFEDYIRHWLWANGERLIPSDVLAHLAKRFNYRPEQHPMLAKGCTIYEESHAITQGFVLRGGRFQMPTLKRPAGP